MDVTFWGAFAGGALSVLSPCVLPLVPPYLCYVAGLSHEELADKTRDVDRWRVTRSALVFVMGFGLVFVAFGATATVFGQVLAAYSSLLSTIAGVLIILFGLHFLGVFRIGLLYRQIRMEFGGKTAGPLGAFLMGMAFAFGWTPCVGPILAAILFVAGGQESIGEGMILLAAYAAGIGLPFLLAAAFVSRFLSLLKRYRRHMGVVEKVSGALLIVTGILFMTGGMAEIAFWLLETVPGLSQIG